MFACLLTGPGLSSCPIRLPQFQRRIPCLGLPVRLHPQVPAQHVPEGQRGRHPGVLGQVLAAAGVPRPGPVQPPGRYWLHTGLVRHSLVPDHVQVTTTTFSVHLLIYYYYSRPATFSPFTRSSTCGTVSCWATRPSLSASAWPFCCNSGPPYWRRSSTSASFSLGNTVAVPLY